MAAGLLNGPYELHGQTAGRLVSALINVRLLLCLETWSNT